MDDARRTGATVLLQMLLVPIAAIAQPTKITPEIDCREPQFQATVTGGAQCELARKEALEQ